MRSEKFREKNEQNFRNRCLLRLSLLFRFIILKGTSVYELFFITDQDTFAGFDCPEWDLIEEEDANEQIINDADQTIEEVNLINFCCCLNKPIYSGSPLRKQLNTRSVRSARA